MSIMVSVMEFDANRELCDSGPRFDATTIGEIIQAPTTAVASRPGHTAAEDDDDDSGGGGDTKTTAKATADRNKGALRLELAEARLEKGSLDDGGNGEKEGGLMSPKSPMSNSSKSGSKTGTSVAAVPHPSPAIGGVQKEVIDDRKALRDALYQGIFHRHRRTIFAMGSFIRMLKSRNSQYNTIRSASDGEDETR